MFSLPVVLLELQMGVSALVVWLLGKSSFLTVDSLQWNKIKVYGGVVIVFVSNIFTNIKALEYSNVETVIVFQTLTSLGVAYGDYKYLNTGMPSSNILISLFIIVFGALCYVVTDSSFRIEGYFWVALY